MGQERVLLERFFRFVESRDEKIVEEWVKYLRCLVIRIDGTKSIEENVDFIIGQFAVISELFFCCLLTEKYSYGIILS